MIPFEDVDRHVRDAFVGLMRTPGLGDSVKKYQTAPREKWRSAGIYAYLKRNDRLVLEVLHLPSHDACAVRVYTEEKTKIYYARKVVGTTDTLPKRLEEASQIFLLQLPQRPLAAKAFDPGPEFPPVVADVMLPIPPPVVLASLEE